MVCYKTSYYYVTCHHFICRDHEINNSSYVLTIEDLINMLKRKFALKIKPTQHAMCMLTTKYEICYSNLCIKFFVVL